MTGPSSNRMQQELSKIERDFNSLLLKCIDETIAGLLGQDVVEPLHLHLNTEYGVATDELPHRLDTFQSALERNFGAVPASTIGKAIARRFYKKLGWEFVRITDYKLHDYVDAAKKRLKE